MLTTPQMRYDRPHFAGIGGLPEVTLLMLIGRELGFQPGSVDVNMLLTVTINCSYNSRYSDSIGLIMKEVVTNFYVYKEQMDKGTEQSKCGFIQGGDQSAKDQRGCALPEG